MENLFSNIVLSSDDLTDDKNTIFFYNSYIINDLKSQGLSFDMVHYWSDGPSNQFKYQFSFTIKFQEKDHGMPADWNFFATSHGKGDNDGAGRDVKNSVWRKVLQGKSVVGDLGSFVTLAKSKYPEFIIEGFKTAEICEATKHLAKQYEKHSKKLPNSIKYYCITIENEKVFFVGHMLNKTCPCHYQLRKDQEEQSNISQSDNTISSTVGQFYKVNYHFLDAKGGEIVQCLTTMCSKNDLEEHLHIFETN